LHLGLARRLALPEPHARGPAHQRARLDETRGPQRRLGENGARAEADARAQPIGLADEGRANLDLDVAEREAVAELQIKPIEQRALRKTRSGGDNSRWISEKLASPPRISRPSRERPSSRLRASELTPTMVATPSAMQATKTRRPASPPRRSRSARRKIAGNGQ